MAMKEDPEARQFIKRLCERVNGSFDQYPPYFSCTIDDIAKIEFTGDYTDDGTQIYQVYELGKRKPRTIYMEERR